MGAVASVGAFMLGSLMSSSFEDEPDEYNDTINDYREKARRAEEARAQAQASMADANRRAEEAAQRETEARNREQEAHQREIEAREREADLARREEEANSAAEQARLDAELARQRGEEAEQREREAREKEDEARRLAEEAKQAALDAQNRELEANARVLETQKRESEARKAADEAREREEQAQKDLLQARFYLEKGIQPEVLPTDEEFQLAKKRIQYDPQKLHFGVCGSSGSGKSSLVNALRGLKHNSPHAAPAGVDETTMAITRYPDPRNEMPFKRLVWFDCPGAGTLNIPGWQYFNQQGLFIFDIIVLVYDTRFSEIDVTIIQNSERFKIPLFIVRSKADAHIRNIMQDLGYDEDEDDARDHYDDYQTRARQSLIDSTRKNLEENLEKAKLTKREVFIVSSNVVYSLIAAKGKKKTPRAIDEVRLIETISNTAYERRYGTRLAARNLSTTDNMVASSSQSVLTTAAR